MTLIQSHFFVLFLVAFGLLVYAHQFAVLRKMSLLTDNLPTLKRTPFTSPAANPASLTVVNATPSFASTPKSSGAAPSVSRWTRL